MLQFFKDKMYKNCLDLELEDFWSKKGNVEMSSCINKNVDKRNAEIIIENYYKRGLKKIVGKNELMYPSIDTVRKYSLSKIESEINKVKENNDDILRIFVIYLISIGTNNIKDKYNLYLRRIGFMFYYVKDDEDKKREYLLSLCKSKKFSKLVLECLFKNERDRADTMERLLEKLSKINFDLNLYFVIVASNKTDRNVVSSEEEEDLDINQIKNDSDNNDEKQEIESEENISIDQNEQMNDDSEASVDDKKINIGINSKEHLFLFALFDSEYELVKNILESIKFIKNKIKKDDIDMLMLMRKLFCSSRYLQIDNTNIRKKKFINEQFEENLNDIDEIYGIFRNQNNIVYHDIGDIAIKKNNFQSMLRLIDEKEKLNVIGTSINFKNGDILEFHDFHKFKIILNENVNDVWNHHDIIYLVYEYSNGSKSIEISIKMKEINFNYLDSEVNLKLLHDDYRNKTLLDNIYQDVKLSDITDWKYLIIPLTFCQLFVMDYNDTFIEHFRLSMSQINKSCAFTHFNGDGACKVDLNQYYKGNMYVMGVNDIFINTTNKTYYKNPYLNSVYDEVLDLDSNHKDSFVKFIKKYVKIGLKMLTHLLNIYKKTSDLKKLYEIIGKNHYYEKFIKNIIKNKSYVQNFIALLDIGNQKLLLIKLDDEKFGTYDLK